MFIVDPGPDGPPDPRIEMRERIAQMPVPVVGFAAQRHLEDADMHGFSATRDQSGDTQMAVSLNYTLWRNPDDRDDPINLADLSPEERGWVDGVPAHRPAWIHEWAARMRYPLLSEAVRTTWFREPSEYSSPGSVLVDHMNHVLRNHFREELGWGDSPGWERHEPTVTERVLREATVRIDDAEIPGVQVDTDPFVYGLGPHLADLLPASDHDGSRGEET